jgi:DNA-binding transcriptional ArsR family regulator
MPRPKEGSRERVLRELEAGYPLDLSIREIAARTGLSPPTVSTWVKVLQAEGRVELSRRVGNATFYRFLRRGCSN